jgi:glycosyltransferase involved in cell wall biosynthesis
VTDPQVGAGDPHILMYAKYFVPRYSGAGRQALSVATALRAQGSRVTFLTEATDDRPNDYDLEQFSVRTFHHSDDSVSLQPRKAAALASIVREYRRASPVIFHAHTAYPEASAMGIAARLAGVPSILKVTLHRSDVDCRGSRLIGRVHRQLLRRQSAIIAISSEIHEELRDLGIAESIIRSIPNGVDTARFQPAGDEQRRSAKEHLGISGDEPVALFVGILNRRKNVHWLLNRWQARREMGRGTLLLVGPASEDRTDSIRQRVERLNVDPASGVRWMGVRERVEEVYAAADLLILPSEAEGMPNVVLEAMAAGVPSLVADGSGMRDLLGAENRTGIRVPFGDADRFDASLATLLEHPERLRSLGRQARERAVEVFSIDSVATKYRSLYAELLRGA